MTPIEWVMLETEHEQPRSQVGQRILDDECKPLFDFDVWISTWYEKIIIKGVALHGKNRTKKLHDKGAVSTYTTSEFIYYWMHATWNSYKNPRSSHHFADKTNVIPNWKHDYVKCEKIKTACNVGLKSGIEKVKLLRGLIMPFKYGAFWLFWECMCEYI